MKVTVCFGNIRVVVPCGDGDLLVSELIEKSIVRYKKATGKPKDYWVAVHNLKATEGGILDTDDQLVDVADDREQIIALYEEQGGPPLHHNGGDGTSASSVGTSSPDIFHGGDLSDHKPRGFRPYIRDGGKNDVIITSSDLQTGSTLIVRRGSEPVLTSIGKSSSGDKKQDHYPTISPSKRWSTISDIDDIRIPRESDELSQHSSPNERPSPYPSTQRSEGIGQECVVTEGNVREGEPDDIEQTDGGVGGSNEAGSLNTFARDSTRRSLANNAAMWKWLDAQETQQERLQNTDRKEPLGGTGDPDEKVRFSPIAIAGEVITLSNTGGPLGIHVVPEYDQVGREQGGLVLQGIEPNGKIYADGRLKVLDKIVEINGKSLKNMEFRAAQELFKQALTERELCLKVIKTDAPPPLPNKPPPLTLPIRTEQVRSLENGHESDYPNSQHQSPPGSPSKKTPPPLPVRHPSTALTSGVNNSLNSSQGKGKIIAPTNTKRIGKKMTITLSKGPQGLGFSVTTRDNPAGGVPPIYIKNILPKGAAIEDGRLKSGDRLLEINNIEMSGKTQSEVVTVLRNTPIGATVNLVVSRIVTEEEEEDQEQKFFVPRELPNSTPPPQHSSVTNSPSNRSILSSSSSHHDTSVSNTQNLPQYISNHQTNPATLQPPEKSGDDGSLTTTEKEYLTFDIALNDSGSAGLGVSVKGKTTTTPLDTGTHAPRQQASRLAQDLGIFIKAIIQGGAASKDGRLMVNDQLVQVNQKNLAGKSNTAAMETLRKAMQIEGPMEGKINLVIARRKDILQPSSLGRSTPSQDHGLISNDSSSNKDVQQSLQSIIKDTVKNSISTDANANRKNYIDLNSNQPPGITPLFNKGNPNSDELRNIFYTKATPSSMIDPTSVMESKNDPVSLRNQNGESKVRPASTIGFQWKHARQVDNLGNKSAISTEDLLDNDGKLTMPDWIKWDENPDVQQDESISPTEIKDGGFSREGFGRQSMSEKRKGHIDPRMSEFYQKVKSLRDKGILKDEPYCSGTLRRAGSTESLLGTTFNSPEPHHHVHERKSSTKELGPTLGLKKSSSLESLQTAVQEVVLEDDAKTETGFYRPPQMNRGMIRGRGCNESFRAAVDRSYENQPTEPMETLGAISVEEVPEGESETGSTISGVERSNSHITSSFNNHQLSLNDDSVGMEKKKRKDSKKEKKMIMSGSGGKSGIFSGLFKFGKQRKTVDEKSQKNTSGQEDNQSGKEQIMANEQDRIEQQRMLQEKQRQLEFAKLREAQHRMALQQQQYFPAGPPSINNALSSQLQEREDSQGGAHSPSERADKIQQLRYLHQQKHRDRLGAYPLDDKEEMVERHLQQYERQIPLNDQKYLQQMRKQRLAEEMASRSPDHYSNHQSLPPRPQHNPDRPERSRSVTADPERYSHYANIEEIRQQLRRHDYHQQQMRYQQQHHQTTATNVNPTVRQRAEMSAHLPPSGYNSGVPSSQSHHYAYPRTLRSGYSGGPDKPSQLYSRSYDPESKAWNQLSIRQEGLQHPHGGRYNYGRSVTPGPTSLVSSGGHRATSPSPSPTRPRAQTPSVLMSSSYSNPPSSPYRRQLPATPHQLSSSNHLNPLHNTSPSSAFTQALPPQQHSSQPHHNVIQQRHYNTDFDARHAYSRERTELSSSSSSNIYQHEPHFGSLQRNRKDRDHTSNYEPHSNGVQGHHPPLGLMSGSAQV